jgi:hypothetical protein
MSRTLSVARKGLGIKKTGQDVLKLSETKK